MFRFKVAVALLNRLERIVARASYAVRIRNRIVELEGVIKAAEIELNDLRIAERVIENLGPDDDDDDASGERRPAKGKTVSDQITDVLTEFGPMESREIFDRVSKRQETTFNTISTTLSRMKDQGIVVLQGKAWGLIDKPNAYVPLSPKAIDPGDEYDDYDEFPDVGESTSG
ncbi:BlaI/MecI/CopY family transcriptional regulator [Xanthobacter aminoxidans]|uniref:BlaI/MecI/CopY family transcriptional regulator n=1 Tax=Xanthobacter aminoxidans TaxID=186280 RepID=UPI00372BBF73